MKTNYRPDRPSGLEGRLKKADFEYIENVEGALKMYGDELSRVNEVLGEKTTRIFRLDRELALHRQYLAVLVSMKGVR